MTRARGGDDQERTESGGAYSDPPRGRRRRYRRRRPAPPASTIYEGDRFRLDLSVVVGVAGVVVGIGLLVNGEAPGLLLLGGGCVAVLMGLWMPHRVMLDASGVVLQAAVRQVRIPWDQLKSVKPPWWDLRHEMLRWGRRRGLAVWTLQAFPALHRMLVEIERRAPRTFVSS